MFCIFAVVSANISFKQKKTDYGRNRNYAEDQSATEGKDGGEEEGLGPLDSRGEEGS